MNDYKIGNNINRQLGLGGSSRRDFIRGVFAAGAALGLGPLRALEMLEKTGGSALADQAAPFYMVNIILGTGALARATVLWPVPMVVEQNQPDFAIDGRDRFQKAALQNGRTLYNRVVDGQPLFAKKPWTVFVAGVSNAHSAFPSFNGNSVQITQNGNANLFSAASQLQNALHALIPAIGVQNGGQSPNYNPAVPGASAPSVVPNGSAMVGLFSSAASQLDSRLKPDSNQALFRQYHTAFLGLARWAGRPTYERVRGDVGTAMGLVTKNLASELAVKPGQVAQWGGSIAQTDDRLRAITEVLIVTANAFRLGLTAQVTLPAFNDDPHGAFAGNPTELFDGFGRSLQSFQGALDNTQDPVQSQKRVGDRLVMTLSGDTTKDPFQRSGWPDGTPGGSNMLFVQSAGWLPGGWVGDVTPNSRVNWDPTTGKNDPNQPTGLCTSAACGAVLYAVSGGSKDAVRPFYNGPLDGITNQNLTGG
jgi:hypothetical protein